MPNFGEHAFCAIRDTRAALLLLAADHGPLQAPLPSTVLKCNTSRFVVCGLISSYRTTCGSSRRPTSENCILVRCQMNKEMICTLNGAENNCPTNSRAG
jgi:hypothetical protein